MQPDQKVGPAKARIRFDIDEPVHFRWSHTIRLMKHGQELPLIQIPSFPALQLARVLALLLILLQIPINVEVVMVGFEVSTDGIESVMYGVVGEGLGQVGKD